MTERSSVSPSCGLADVEGFDQNRLRRGRRKDLDVFRDRVTRRGRHEGAHELRRLFTDCTVMDMDEGGTV